MQQHKPATETHDQEDVDVNKLSEDFRHLDRRLCAIERGSKGCDCADCDLVRRAEAGEPATAADVLRATESAGNTVSFVSGRVNELSAELAQTKSRIELVDLTVIFLFGFVGYVTVAHGEAIVELARRVRDIARSAIREA